MSVRARGEHQHPHMHRWRLKQPGAPHRHTTAIPDAPPDDVGAVASRRAPRARRAGLIAVIMLALLGAGAAGYGTRPLPAAPSGSLHPSTPRAWFDAYMAAAVDNAARVCDVLFAPELAATYARTPQRSCPAYFNRVSDSPVQITGIRSYKNTAIVRLRQRLAPRNAWTVVLDRVQGGWRAVDLLSGD